MGRDRGSLKIVESDSSLGSNSRASARFLIRETCPMGLVDHVVVESEGWFFSSSPNSDKLL